MQYFHIITITTSSLSFIFRLPQDHDERGLYRSVRIIAITTSHLGVAKSNDDQIWNRLVIRGTKFHSNNTSKQRVADK